MNKKFLWLILIIGALFLLGSKIDFLSILPQSNFYQQTILKDQFQSTIYTTDSILKNVECPDYLSNPAARDSNCGNTLAIFIDDKVYECGGDSEQISKACRLYGQYEDLSFACQNNPASFCTSLRTKFGTIQNPLNEGSHSWEFLSFRKIEGSDNLIYSAKTITIASSLKCGDNICTFERGENNQNCPSDCTTSSCFNGIQDLGELGIDCGGACSPACSPDTECIPLFSYGNYGACIQGIETREYTDQNHCGINPLEPLQRSCQTDSVDKPILNPGISTVLIIVGIAIILILWWFLKKKG